MTQQDVSSVIDNAEFPHWPKPEPIQAELLPVEPFDYDLVPDVMAPWLRDIADSLQCPPDYLLVPLYCSLGALMGRKLGIRPQARTIWTETPNLWGMIVGRPAAMKSPSMKEVMKHIARLEYTARKKHEAEMIEYKQQSEAYEEEKRKASKQAVTGSFNLRAPVKPKAKRYIVVDSTYEALGIVLASNPNGVMNFRDELIALLKTLDQEQNIAARGFFLSAWNGTQSYSFDRIGRGSVHIEAACVTLMGGTQPGRLADYISKAEGAGDDGMIQRFSLLVWPDLDPEFKDHDHYPDTYAREQAWAVFDRLDKFEPSAIGAEQGAADDIPFLRFDDVAREEFAAWRRGHEQRLRSGELHPALESHLGKYRKLVPALALINHMVDVGHGPVGASSLLRALACAAYLESHARRAYAAGSVSTAQAAAKAISRRIKDGSLKGLFTARDVHQKNWTNLSHREHVAEGLAMLEELHWVRKHTDDGTGGRPKEVYTINPKVSP